MTDANGYENVRCYFCGKKGAGYWRGDDDNHKANHDACESCAKKPYPQSKQFREEKDSATAEQKS